MFRSSVNFKTKQDVEAAEATRLVTDLALYPMAGHTVDGIRERMPQFSNWHLLFEIAARAGVAPVVFTNLEGHFRETLPPEIALQLTMLHRSARGTVIGRTLVLLDLVKLFEQAEIPVIVLKGPAVAIAAYGDPSMRTLGDFDLMVAREHLGPASKLLVSQGYDRIDHGRDDESLIANQDALEFWNGRMVVELHWAPMSRHLCFHMDIEELWARCHTEQCLSSAIRVLSIHHLFLYLCAHGAKHEWSTLRWICDVAQIESQLSADDRKTILTLANNTRSRRLLALGLRVAAQLLDHNHGFREADLEPERDSAHLVRIVTAKFEPRAARSSRRTRFDARMHPNLRALLFWVRARERVRDRAATLYRVMLGFSSGGGRVARSLGARQYHLAAWAARQLFATFKSG